MRTLPIPFDAFQSPTEPSREPDAMAKAMEAASPDEIADPMLKSFRHFADEQKEDRLALAACSRGARVPLTPRGDRLLDVLASVGGAPTTATSKQHRRDPSRQYERGNPRCRVAPTALAASIAHTVASLSPPICSSVEHSQGVKHATSNS